MSEIIYTVFAVIDKQTEEPAMVLITTAEPRIALSLRLSQSKVGTPVNNLLSTGDYYTSTLLMTSDVEQANQAKAEYGKLHINTLLSFTLSTGRNGPKPDANSENQRRLARRRAKKD